MRVYVCAWVCVCVVCVAGCHNESLSPQTDGALPRNLDLVAWRIRSVRIQNFMLYLHCFCDADIFHCVLMSALFLSQSPQRSRTVKGSSSSSRVGALAAAEKDCRHSMLEKVNSFCLPLKPRLIFNSIFQL